MSKAEKENRINSLAVTFLERQQIKPNPLADQIIRAYKEGYHQAEKDVALTWEDINRIEIIIKDVYRDYPHGIEVKQFGVEVLNRFYKIKGE